MERVILKKLATMFAVASLALVGATAALAGGGYGSQPGFEVANANTVCAGHGAFGAFGTFGDVTHDFGINNPGSNGVPGADGTQTGINNSTLCGNPQNEELPRRSGRR